MKNSILKFGIALIAFTNVAFANGNGESTIKFPPTTEETVMKPTSITENVNVKTIEEVIAEDNSIIESDFAAEQNQLEGKSIEYIIEEDNRIIESNVSQEIQPLDFKKINRKMPSFKMRNAKSQLIGEL